MNPVRNIVRRPVVSVERHTDGAQEQSFRRGWLVFARLATGCVRLL